MLKHEYIIGVDGDLVFKDSEDIKRFKRLTIGYPVIMGRKTYESIGKPLSARHNIVVTRQRYYQPDGVTVVHSLDKALQVAETWNQATSPETWIIGGGEIYRQTLDMADRLYITQSHQDVAFRYEHEFTTFPEIDIKKYKAIYDEKFETHTLNVYSKTSLLEI